MIEKIHYVWLSEKALQASAATCIINWKKYCHDIEIIQWNETKFSNLRI